MYDFCVWNQPRIKAPILIHGPEFNQYPRFQVFVVNVIKTCIRAKLRKQVNLTIIRINNSGCSEMLLLLGQLVLLRSLMFCSSLASSILYLTLRLGIKLYVLCHAQVIFHEGC